MALIETGSSSTGIANVDAAYNLATTLPQVTTPAGVSAPQYVGAARLFSENDAGTSSGTAFLQSPETSSNWRLRTGLDTILFNNSFNATTQNTNIWSYTFATMTASQPGAGTLNFGTVQGTASTHGAFMRTFQYFPLFNDAQQYFEIEAGQFGAALVANEEWRVGFGLPSAAGTAPTNGVWFKLTSTGLIGEIMFNGVLTSTSTLKNIGDFTVGSLYKFGIVVGLTNVDFWLDNVYLGNLATPTGSGQSYIGSSLPIFMQKLCTGSVTNTNTMRVSSTSVVLMDVASNKSWSEQLATAGNSGYVGQNGHTQGKTTLWTNNTAPTAVALTNTAAAFTGLGGIVAVLPTLTANNDGKLITYQNPASTVNITGRNLIITGVSISGAVSVILAGGPVIYAYALAFGHTATSLATAESASFATGTTHAPRIVPLGIATYAATAAVGVLGQPINITFDVPIVVRPGEFVDIVARNIGVVTTTGAITQTIMVSSYFE